MAPLTCSMTCSCSRGELSASATALSLPSPPLLLTSTIRRRSLPSGAASSPSRNRRCRGCCRSPSPRRDNAAAAAAAAAAVVTAVTTVTTAAVCCSTPVPIARDRRPGRAASLRVSARRRRGRKKEKRCRVIGAELRTREAVHEMC